MRLTLRTLLAYLDDRLSPANARELGQKLAKSPFATELAGRIKEVVRRRRLAKDNVQTIDANLIAEYLDDQLTPELVALIEKEILASDHSLAEVAAAHQILGLLSDPVEISDGLKDRLHQLDPFTEEPDQEPTPREEGEGASETNWTPLQRQAEAQKRSPMLLLVIMVLGWLALLATDSNLFQRDRPIVQNDPADADADVAAAPDGAASPQPGGAGQPTETTPTETGTPIADASVRPGQVAGASPGKAADGTQPPASASDLAQPATVVPNTSPGTKSPGTTSPGTTAAAPTTVGTNQGSPVETVPATEPPSQPPSETAASQPQSVEPIELTDKHGMLVLRDPDSGSWNWASGAGTEPVHNWSTSLSTQFAVVSEPFRVTVRAPRSGWSARILGPAVFRISQGEQTGVHLLEGRMLLSGDIGDRAATLNLKAGRRMVSIDVAAGQDVVGVSVLPQPVDLATPADENSDAALLPLDNACTLMISAVSADVQVRVGGSPQPISFMQGNTWRWNTANDLATAGSQSVTNIVPEWIFEARNPPSDLQLQTRTETAAAYKKSGSVTGAALEVAENRNPQIASYGVRLLSMIGNVNNLTALLLQSEEEPIRREAIVGLQKIVQETRAGREQTLAALQTRLPAMELDNAMRLISGVTRTAAEDRRTSEWLVGMLENGRVAMRELAIFNLERLTNDRSGFFAGDDSSRRDAAVRRWKRFLDRNDGRLFAPPQ
ncbi:MAG: hypothetical protein RIK87_09615 [Fuerstiella sp.]